VYNFSGERVRKVIERQASQGQNITKLSDRIILDGTEHFTRFNGQGEVTLECQTLHIQYGTMGVALVERWSGSLQASKNLPSTLIRFQYSNRGHSITLELDDSGNILSYEEYTPYGNSTYQAFVTKAPKRFRYSCKERDRDTGFYYFGKRYYIPWLCRWLCPDPLGTLDGLNTYEYVACNPVEHDDPDGTSATKRKDAKKRPDYKLMEKTRKENRRKGVIYVLKKVSKKVVSALSSLWGSILRKHASKVKGKGMGRGGTVYNVGMPTFSTPAEVATNMAATAVHMRTITKVPYNNSHLIPSERDRGGNKILLPFIDVDLWQIRVHETVNQIHMKQQLDQLWAQHFKEELKPESGKGPTITKLEWYKIKGKGSDEDKTLARQHIISTCRHFVERLGYGEWSTIMEKRQELNDAMAIGKATERVDSTAAYDPPEWYTAGGGFGASVASKASHIQDEGYEKFYTPLS
jgi:RHS repeat-associated protein